MAVDRSLGGIVSRVRVWHDNGGSSPSWYLSRLIVRDLQTNRCQHFLADRWLSLVDREDRCDVNDDVSSSELVGEFESSSKLLFVHSFPHVSTKSS